MGLDLGGQHRCPGSPHRRRVAGLQLASISLQGRQHDAADFIDAFTGSHRFVLDYLVEEVLHRQSESVQRFLPANFHPRPFVRPAPAMPCDVSVPTVRATLVSARLRQSVPHPSG